MARQQEMVKQQQTVVRGEGGDGLPIGLVHGKGGNTRGDNPKLGRMFACTRCGKTPQHEIPNCPARNAICRKCSKRGHFQAVCRSSGRALAVHQIQEDSSEEVFLGSVDSPEAKPWVVALQANGKPTEFHIDTGAAVTVIPESMYAQLGSPPLHPAAYKLKGQMVQISK